VSDQFDVAVHDAEALAEIEMLANLIVATSEHEGRVPEDRIDEILGVAPADDATSHAASPGDDTHVDPTADDTTPGDRG
jgi:hypothetical protein